MACQYSRISTPKPLPWNTDSTVTAMQCLFCRRTEVFNEFSFSSLEPQLVPVRQRHDLVARHSSRVPRNSLLVSFTMFCPSYSPKQKRCFSPRISRRFATGTGEAITRSPISFSARNLKPSLTSATRMTPSSRGA